ncbi:MAG TPA: rhodanese-like domain-containing protein [Actinomycetota bacterium]|nr:rhodanese-like domain-containing protein [Actinomycetota bacterium]
MKAEELQERQRDVQLLDVRRSNEWAAGRIDGAVHVPLHELADRLSEVDPTRLVVVTCRTGPRSLQAAELLEAQGFRIDTLEGGIRAWVEHGLPIIAADGSAGSVVDPEEEPPADAPPAAPAGPRGFAIPAIGDLALAGTIADTAERLGYTTVWTDDRPESDGLEAAAAMLAATTAIRIGIGPLACDRRTAEEAAGWLAGRGLDLSRLVVAVGPGASPTPEAATAAYLADLRRLLGAEVRLGMAAVSAAMCRLAGETAELVLLEWMNPERIQWARAHVDQGWTTAGRRAGKAPPEVVAYIRTTIGEGAALRLSASAAPYASSPPFAQNFAEMGLAAVGVAAVVPSWAGSLLRPYEQVLDEAAIKPVVTLPSSANPDLGQVFYPLSILLEIAQGLHPGTALPGTVHAGQI